MMQQNTDNMPQFYRSISAEGAPQPISRLLLMTPQASTLPSFQRRTAEGARQLRDNLNTVIREIQPLVETARTVNAGAISISNYLYRPISSEPNISRQQGNDFVINFDSVPVNNQGNLQGENNINVHVHTHRNSIPDGNTENNNNPEEDPNAERTQIALEAQQFLQVLLKYVPFVLILLLKGLYDHHEGIFNVIVLFATFVQANSVVKKEATKRGRRSLSKLFVAFLYITACIIFIHYIFEEEKLYLNLIFIRTYKQALTVWDLLWIVGITDFILKLITIVIKIFLTMLPGWIVPFQKRGKIYLYLEASSQLYRSLATIQPWLFYLLESYQGPEKIVGVFLSAFYMVSKGADLMGRLRLFKIALLKLLQNVTIGAAPSKEQIQTAGDHCPICHDEYDSPVLLQCRHIFCEGCVSTWFDREQTCPLCRAKIVDDPTWRDGSTTYFMQLF